MVTYTSWYSEIPIIKGAKSPFWIKSLTRVFRFFKRTPCATKKYFFKNGDPYVQAPGTVLKESYPIGHPNPWGLKNHTWLHPWEGQNNA